MSHLSNFLALTLFHSLICDICFVNIILIGYMGCGKTTIGQRLAALLGRDFYDLDQVIESHYGASISTIFKEKGTVYFRKLEAKVLGDLLEHQTDVVVATGGGTPVYGDNMSLINDAKKNRCVYLKVDNEVLIQRLWKQRQHRPLIASISAINDLEEFVRKHLFERTFTYEMAQLKIDVTDFDANRAAQAIKQACIRPKSL